MRRLRHAIERALAWLLSPTDEREMLTGTVVASTTKIAGLCLSYLGLLVTARWYGADIVGGLSLATVLFGICSLAGGRGAPDAVIRLTAESVRRHGQGGYRATYRKLLHFYLLLGIVMSVMLFGVASLLAKNVFGNPELTKPIRVISLGLPFASVMFVTTATLRGVKRIALATFLSTVLQPGAYLAGVVILAILTAKTVTSVVSAYVISFLLCSVISLLWLSRSDTHSSMRRPSSEPPSLGQILSLSLPMFVSSGMVLLFGWTDLLMLGAFCSNEAVGIYNIAFKVAALVAFSLSAVSSIAATQFATAHSSHCIPRLKRLAAHSAQLACWIGIPILLAILLMPSAILGLFGGNFREGAACLRLLALAQAFSLFCGLNGGLLNVCGGHRQFRNIMIVLCLFNAILNSYLVPMYGAMGAAVATATSMVFGNLAMSVAAFKRFGFWAGFRLKRQRIELSTKKELQ